MMKNNFGLGTSVGSGHQSKQATNSPKITIGSATMRMTPIWRRTKAPTPASPLAITKPSTNTACQASGLKNQVPDTGQVGSVMRKASTIT